MKRRGPEEFTYGSMIEFLKDGADRQAAMLALLLRSALISVTIS